MTKRKVTNKQVNDTNGFIRLTFRPDQLVIAFTLFWFLVGSTSFAQLRLVPLKKTSSANQPSVKPANSGRTMSSEPLTLPFWDDFSKQKVNSNGLATGVPDTSLWVNSRSAWVNSGMGINPPSINVVTFDGLDSLNQPYDASHILLNGFTDQLVSKPIDLSVISMDERDSVYLSFFYQWKGNGEAPDLSDYLQLDFKNKDSIWETILTLQTDEVPNDTIFKEVITQVDSIGQRFFHDTFQFRFRRFGRKSGPYDTWNVDYIYLDSSRYETNIGVPDIAIASEISPLFKPYRSVPITHFFESKYLDNLQFDVFNLKNDIPTSTSYNATAKFLNYYTDPTLDKVFEESLATNVGVPTTGPNIGLVYPLSKGRAELLTLPDPNDPNQFDPAADSITIRLKFEVINNDPSEPFPVNLSSNDTLSSISKLKDYYAYDDGVAEYSAVLNQAGNGAAVRFDMLTDKDTVVALDFYFPDFVIDLNQTTNIFIYNDNDGKPGDVIGKFLSYTVRKNGSDFSRIRVGSVPVTKTFYAGWTELTDGKVKVGLDFSNDTDDKIFVKVGGVWSQGPDVHGSLMIRPVFGKGELVTGLPEENVSAIACYPNPNNGTFFVKGKYEQLLIINSTGQSIPFYAEGVNTETKVTLQSSSPGLYLVQVRNGKFTKTSKMIVR